MLKLDRLIICAAAAGMTAASAFGQNLTVSSFSAYAGQTNILLQAAGNVVFSGGTMALPALPAGASVGQLTVEAGNDIIVNSGVSISAGVNWNVTMIAGTGFSGTTAPLSGSDGIYLDGNAYLEAQNGDIILVTTNEVQVGWSGSSAGAGVVNPGAGGITTVNGGNISVTTEFGDVNRGASEYGFNYSATAPYQTVSSSLGGIGTADGGNLNIDAGGNVVSFSATTVAVSPSSPTAGDPDPGTGAFGSAPGNVTISAGENVYGCFVVMNGQGTMIAQNVGTSAKNVALSLATGGWNLNAQTNIYLQEVRNPNGLYNITTVSSVNHQPSAANHLFNYSPEAYVNLSAGNAVNITGFNLPRNTGNGVPLLLPSAVSFNAGPGGAVLDTPTAYDQNESSVALSDYDITLFPSAYQSLDVTNTSGGGLSSGSGGTATLLMSDSGYTKWFSSSSGIQPFGVGDHANVPLQLNNDNPVLINLTGSMSNITLQTDKATQVNVAADMTGCSFYGENLNAGDVTSINVGGRIYNAGSFASITLAQVFPSVPAADTPPVSDLPSLPSLPSLSSWYLALALAVNPDSPLLTTDFQGESPSYILQQINEVYGNNSSLAIDIAYNPSTKTLTAVGPMSSALLTALESPTLTLIRYNADGTPALNSQGYLVTDTVNWTPANSGNYSLIASLYTASQNSIPLGAEAGVYAVGGTGQLNVTAGSISLGNSEGILSVGSDNSVEGRNYSYLAPYITSGSTINVRAGSLDMPASTIASLSGGDVNVNVTGEITNSSGVSIDLGSQDLAAFETQIMALDDLGLGIYTSAGGNVNVTAYGSINIDSSRIATFDGGNVSITSLTGNVDAGSGGGSLVPIDAFSPGYSFFEPFETVYASGIVALTFSNGSGFPGAATVPGNITVNTPQGNICASEGGILQEALGAPLPAGPTIQLTAGTPGTPGYIGNINLGGNGVVGGTLHADATGNIAGPALQTSIGQNNGVLTISWNAEGVMLDAQAIPNFAVQSSPDLVNWTTVNPTVSANANGGLSFQSSIQADSTSGFYRILWQ